MTTIFLFITPLPRHFRVAQVALIVLFRLWEPIGGVVWHVEQPVFRAVLYGIFALGFWWSYSARF